MLASQANKWSSCLAVLALLALAGLSRADLSPEAAAHTESDDDYHDDMTRAIKVVWAGHKQRPAGFERTQKALITILNELTAPDVRSMQLPEQLLDARRLASTFLSVCELSRPKCDLVFDELAAIKREHVLEDSINQLPFLEVCERAHTRFCEQVGSGESAKKRVWYELKREVAREEAAARGPEEEEEDGKKNVWTKLFPKRTTVA